MKTVEQLIINGAYEIPTASLEHLMIFENTLPLVVTLPAVASQGAELWVVKGGEGQIEVRAPENQRVSGCVLDGFGMVNSGGETGTAAHLVKIAVDGGTDYWLHLGELSGSWSFHQPFGPDLDTNLNLDFTQVVFFDALFDDGLVQFTKNIDFDKRMA